MNFEEFKNQALVLLREAEGKGLLGVDHPIASKKRELQRLFMQGLDDGAERSQRLLQLKRLGFGSLINQWTSHCQSIEEWKKLFDEVENITGQEAQKVMEEEKEQKEEQKERQEKREEKEREQIQLAKQPKADEALTISERAVNYLYGQSKIKGIARFDSRGRELDYKLLWAVDFLSSELSKQCGFDKAKKNELALFKNATAFDSFFGDIVEGRISPKEAFVEFKFEASKVRKWFGFTSNEMPIKDVVGLFEKLQEVIFVAEGEPILRDAEKNEWAVKKVSDPLYSLEQKILGVVSNRWKTKDVLITLRLGGINIMSWIFLANLSCGKKGWMTLPKNARHELDGYGQNILRWLRLWKKPRKINVFDLASIAGLKYKEAYRLIIALKRTLNDLKEKSYIKDFEATGKGKNTWFVIVKAEEALKDQAQCSKRLD